MVKQYLIGRAVLLQFKGQGPVGSSFTGHHLPSRNYLHSTLAKQYKKGGFKKIKGKTSDWGCRSPII